MKYQLVLQFRAMSPQDYDALVSLENLLIENLPLIAEIDGHDFSSNEFNIIVLTDQPEETFCQCEKLIEQHHRRQFKAAYRETGKDEFVVLLGLENFEIA